MQVPEWAIERASQLSPTELLKKTDALKLAQSVKTLAETAQGLLDSDLPRKNKLIILGALVYLVTVVDAVPDVIFIIGYLDDAAVLQAAIKAAA
jgi:uncharacterized membrane protein YkvA (DUF1232 family)